MPVRPTQSISRLVARLDLQTLQIFLTAVDTGSLSETAAREHLAVSAVSRRIGALEELLGAPMLERRHDGVVATAAGRDLVKRIRELLGVVDSLQDDLERHIGGSRGEVRLHSNTSALLDRLPRRIAAFTESHPAIHVRLKEWDSVQVVRAVRDGEAHVGVHSSYVDTTGLQTYPFTKTRLVLLAPADHPLACRREVRFEETLQYEYVVLKDGTSFSALLTRMLEESKRLPAAMHVRVEAGTVGTACRFVQAGLGITLVVATSARLFAAQLGLVEVQVLDDWAHVQHNVCVRDAATLPAAARRLFDFLRDEVEISD